MRSDTVMTTFILCSTSMTVRPSAMRRINSMVASVSFGVYSSRRFIKQQQARIIPERHSQLEPAPFSVGQLSGQQIPPSQ